MKRNKLVSIAAITVALGVLATGCAGGSGSSKSESKSSGGTKTVTVKAGTGANVKPYTYVGDDNETTGYDVEVLKEVFDRLDGYDLQIEVTDIPSVFSGVTSGTYQIGVNNFSYNEERAKSYLYSYPYDKIGYVFITKKGAPEVKTFADAAGKSFEGQSGVSVTTAIESWNEKNPDKKIDITYTDADTAITLQHAEVIRASLESVPKGQIEAANALGMTYFQALRRVILPEAIVVALPSLGNSFIGLIKGTSLAFVCAVVEMTAAGKIIAGRTYRYFEVYVSLAIIYWIITIIVEQGIKLIEKKIRIPENAPAIQTDEGALNQ